MNIPNEIYEYAQKYGIDWTSTGGGCDFIIRTIGQTELKLADPKDTGWCPDSIDNEGVVCIESKGNWNGEKVKKFPNCRDAIDWMAKQHEQTRQLTAPKARNGHGALHSDEVRAESACMVAEEKQETRRNIE